jgi:hypothetical protein
MATAVHLHRFQPGTHQKIIDMAMNGVDAGQQPALWALASTRFYVTQKLRPQSVIAHTADAVTFASLLRFM